ncbi:MULTISPECIES: sigma-70 family RNA polymerase sigma factor [Nocardia]|uniref:Sigma-70 family RNA polymerase sigma factor n=1 Tax=Nocardia coubleae TaxID=356147 RepID=A0A846W8J3_9NOCA|nr:sigma-70 family RNA polymerase sigma factor [Nocardia coubleae]NKX88907.1 sigma-70 family RNA polymerase sigma factor [Nocardia coubleae]
MVSPLLADLFESHRAHLISVAYRLTGSVGDAEDAVQESWLRMAGAHQSEIEDLRAWLTTVVSRICLDHLRSAAVRRETYVGQWLPEPIVTGQARTDDPLEVVVRNQDNRMAAMVVLDALTPQQRVALVLHDSLAVPFDEIADILGVSPDAARQLAVRARKTVARTPPPVTDDVHDEAVQRFLAALATGDIAAVAATLHPDVNFIADAGGTARTALNVVEGAEKVARLAVGLWRKQLEEPALEIGFAAVNGQSGLVLTDPNSPFGRAVRVLAFSVRDGLVCAAYDFANVAKLSGARLRT